MLENTCKKGNVLLVANWESNVGYAWWLMENFWVTIAQHFSDRSTFLIYPKVTGTPQSIASSKITTSELDFSDHSFYNLRRVHHYIKTNSIRYIYLTDNPTYSWYYILLRLWGVKKIVMHDHTPGIRTKPNGIKKTLKCFIQRIPYLTADHFIAVTDFVHKRHIEVNCSPIAKCSTAKNGITPINLNILDTKYAHHCFNIPEQRLIVVTTGRASYYKGIDFFIRCADELINKQQLEQLHFLFCGDGPDIKEFQALVEKLAIKEHFTFAGKRTDIPEILASCHIGLHAATGEVGYSLSILEYMSAGLVTIVPDNPSTSLSITNMNNGILYKQRDLLSATDSIKRALDEEFAETVATNAIMTVKENFHITDTNKQLISILQPIFNPNTIASNN